MPSADDTYKVLVVDDNEAGRYRKRHLLEKGGLFVLEAMTGAEAIELVHQHSPPLVLLDVKLPDISGLDICKALKGHPEFNKTLVLQISAHYTSTIDRTSGLEHGADAYLTEPVAGEELMAWVRALLRIYDREHENRQLVRTLRGLTGTLEGRILDQTEKLWSFEDRVRILESERNLIEGQERQKLAAELHDHLAQWLAVARMKLHQTHGNQSLPMRELDEVLETCIHYTQTLVFDLSPRDLKDTSLETVCQWLVTQFARHGFTVHIHASPPGLTVSSQLTLTCFQCVRELLFNAWKHSDMNEATVTISMNEDDVHIVVEDHGKGCEISQASKTGIGSFGLPSIYERMKAIGGRFEFLSEPGKGTKATLTIPGVCAIKIK